MGLSAAVRQQNHACQLAVILKGSTAFDPHLFQAALFTLPHGFIFHRVAEFLVDHGFIIILQPPDERIFLLQRKRQIAERLVAVQPPVRSPRHLLHTDIDGLHIHGIFDHLYGLIHNCLQMQCFGHGGTELFQFLRLPQFFFHKQIIYKYFPQKRKAQISQQKQNRKQQRIILGCHRNVLLQYILEIRRKVEKQHQGKEESYPIAQAGRCQHLQTEQPSADQGVQQQQRVKQAAENVDGKSFKKRNANQQIPHKKYDNTQHHRFKLLAHSSVFPADLENVEQHFQHHQTGHCEENSHFPVHFIHKGPVLARYHQLGRFQENPGKNIHQETGQHNNQIQRPHHMLLFPREGNNELVVRVREQKYAAK